MRLTIIGTGYVGLVTDKIQATVKILTELNTGAQNILKLTGIEREKELDSIINKIQTLSQYSVPLTDIINDGYEQLKQAQNKPNTTPQEINTIKTEIAIIHRTQNKKTVEYLKIKDLVENIELNPTTEQTPALQQETKLIKEWLSYNTHFNN